MGIRDTSYYGWNTKTLIAASPGSDRQYRGICSMINIAGVYYALAATINDPSGSGFVVVRSSNLQEWEVVDFFVCTSSLIKFPILANSNNRIFYCCTSGSMGIVRSSPTGLSGTFETVDSFSGQARAMVIDSSDAVYVGGAGAFNFSWKIRKSSDGSSGSFGDIDGFVRTASQYHMVNDMAIDSNGVIYAVGAEFVSSPSQGRNWIVRRSTTGLSASFSYVDNVNNTAGNSDEAAAVAINSNGVVYVAGTTGYSGGGNLGWTVRKSDDGTSGSFSEIDTLHHLAGGAASIAKDIALDSKNNIYVIGTATGSPGAIFTKKSASGASGSFVIVDGHNFLGPSVSLFVDNDDTIYVLGSTTFTGGAAARIGKLTANSASLGPTMFASSVGYALSESIDSNNSLVSGERFKLNNVSEFPHSSGLFQMKNIILGTQDSGKIGTNEDSIIKVNHIGSVVKVMWPRQDDINTIVKGFGDSSIGQRIGKLTSIFDPGDSFDVTEFDHMSLYCYLRKEVSGTLDDVVIQVERKPLKNIGFTTDQAIEYSVSGSVTEARLRDLEFKKQINYGDLSIREIGYPIDVPLTNVREVRISAKHQTGQSIDVNKNFIVFGRFIKSEEET